MLIYRAITKCPLTLKFPPNCSLRHLTSQKPIAQDKQTILYRDSSQSSSVNSSSRNQIPTKCDIVIIGGGGMGSSTAYFLKKQAGKKLNVLVIERDFTYSQASTPLSAGCIRQQFTVPENIMMSRYGIEFIKSFKKDIDSDIDINFRCNGNLSLADENGAEIMAKNVTMQNSLGVKSETLSVQKLKEKMPWINTQGLALAAYGCVDEGWFDPWALLMGLRKKAQSLGVQYVEGEVVDFDFKSNGGEYDTVSKVVLKTANGDERAIEFDKCALTAGAFSGAIARKARIGCGSGLLHAPLAIEPRKRYIYVIKSKGQNIPPVTAPLTIDVTKVYFRREGLGGNFICGLSPSPENEPPVDNLDVDMGFFETEIWPNLAYRIPGFESLKVVGAWAGFYEYHCFDGNGVVGKHPAYENFYIAAGFSGHGIQKVPAVGRAMSELILHGSFKSIDLSLLGFNRIIENSPIVELAMA